MNRRQLLLGTSSLAAAAVLPSQVELEAVVTSQVDPIHFEASATYQLYDFQEEILKQIGEVTMLSYDELSLNYDKFLLSARLKLEYEINALLYGDLKS